jgi:hypothetical protein
MTLGEGGNVVVKTSAQPKELEGSSPNPLTEIEILRQILNSKGVGVEVLQQELITPLHPDDEYFQKFIVHLYFPLDRGSR